MIPEETYSRRRSSASSSFERFFFSFLVSAFLPPLPSPASFFGAPAYFTAHSCATRLNSFGFRVSIPATSASCGSFGSGVLRSDCREMRAALIVRTGDHAVDKVSRQMAPCKKHLVRRNTWTGERSNYRLTADIWVPDLCLELHHGGLERVIARYPNIDLVDSPFVRRSRRPLE